MATAVLPQHVQITTPDLRAMSQPEHIDPDISATLSDFLTYTEHLPSSVVRSLTLIATQDRIASDLQQTIHELLTTYTFLPSTKDAPDAVRVRRDISHAYDRLEKARRMSAAESVRMADMVYKDRARLDVVREKLKSMPMPPSRDPTPEPVSSPQLRKAQPTPEKRAAHRTGTAPRVNARKIMVPGEVLPPPNPDSPPPSEPSDWESPPPSPGIDRGQRQKSVGRQRTPKPYKPPRERSHKPPRARSLGAPGTNVHSAVAGISTSNALLALVAPPPDAKPGSKWLPWKRITEFELAKLRKRMKKNAIWLPSPAMRNRELKNLGRGQQALDEAKAVSEASGEPFIDEYDSGWSDPTKAVMTGEEKAEMVDMLGPEMEGGNEDDALMNRGMRLNEAKKRKRERQLEELAIQAQLDAEQGIKREARKSVEIGELTKVPTPKANKMSAPAETGQKKRKRDATPIANTESLDHSTLDSPDVLSLARPDPQPKRLKLSIQAATSKNGPSSAGATSSIKIPLAAAAMSPRKSAAPTPTVTSPRFRSRNASVAPESNLAVPGKTGPKITLKSSKAASAEPPNRRLSLRRGSNASLPGGGKLGSPAPVLPAAGAHTRRKRPAPGMIAPNEDGGTNIGVSKRKAAPKIKGKKEDTAVAPVAVVEEEIIDPDEPRYCVCGDVSYGTMIACDADDVSVQ